jgi:hypothetical protein
MMMLSLYDAVIPSNIQILGAIDGLLDKAESFATERGIAPETLIGAKLAPDMLPFGYQVKACTDHSIGGVEGVRGGSFSPSRKSWPTDFAGLHELVRGAIEELRAVDRAEVDALTDKDTQFSIGETKLPFTGGQFLLSFSQPNFYFHATTAYGILRAQGLVIGKRDFIGQLRIKR